jgi:hypothetical protein
MSRVLSMASESVREVPPGCKLKINANNNRLTRNPGISFCTATLSVQPPFTNALVSSKGAQGYNEQLVFICGADTFHDKRSRTKIYRLLKQSSADYIHCCLLRFECN